MSIRAHAGWIALALAAAAAGDADAQARTPLQDAKSVTCELTVMAAGTWGRDGAPTGGVKPATLKVAFSNIDTEVGDAETAGLTGNVHIHRAVRRRLPALHARRFVRLPARDNRLRQGEPPGKLKAVHTRREYTDIALPGFTSRPEQYYGECEVQ